MSIYDKNGSVIYDAFGIDGNRLSTVYDAQGNLINLINLLPDDDRISRGLFWNHGKLTKSGKYLIDANNKQMEIRGIGTHFILQYSNLHTLDCINALRSYGVNCLRISVYLEDYTPKSSDNQPAYGYLSHPQETKTAIKELVDICTELGMYVLLDWHVYADGAARQGITGTAMLHRTEAEDFFEYFSNRYKKLPNIMYEIANEPYYTLTAAQCLPYIRSIRSIIRANDPNAVIVMNNASDGIPVLYNTLSNDGITDIFVSTHQYGQNVVSQYQEWWNTYNYPLFNTEWGNSSPSGDGAGNDAYAEALLDWYHASGIPHAFWKFTDQTMTTSVLNNLGTINSETYADGFGDSDLSHNGTLFLQTFKRYATTEHIERPVVEE